MYNSCRIERPGKEVEMERYFSIIKNTAKNGEVKYIFRSSLGSPRLEHGEELVATKKSTDPNPPTRKRTKIFRDLREKAREKNIKHVINLDL